jgi:hypothetical protein
MNRRMGALTVGLALGVALTPAAQARNGIDVKDVNVFQGSGLHFTANVVYSCGASSDAKGIDLVVHDTVTDANGHGEANYPACDGNEHLVKIPGESTDGGTFRSGDQATVRLWMSDSHVNTVPGADHTRTIALH